MGNADTKLNFRKAVVQLTSKTQVIEASDDIFWDQFWSENVTNVQDIFTLIPAPEIRVLREEAPSNLATLCYKAVEKLVKAVDSSCRTQREHQTVLNCCRLLTRLLPYIFEDPDWKGFFWSSLPGKDDEESLPLAHSLLNALCDLLFCPDFTVTANRKSGPDKADELQSIDSCEYIWEAGVGFAYSPPKYPILDSNRTELLKLLLTCFSETMYNPPTDLSIMPNRWIQHLTSSENRHALPMFTSLLNTVCAYDPVGYGVPYNHLLFTDSLEPLVDVALQILIVTLDHDTTGGAPLEEGAIGDNLFINYLSRIHRDEDFQFVLKGITRLLNNPLMQTYLPNSTKKVHFHQELLVFFWKMCDYNKKFLYYVLKSSDVLEVLVPILYHLNDSRADQSRVGLMHIGVFILLLLSGERNFGVRLNKPYTATVPMDIPVFTGTKLPKLPETWWTPGTENSVNNDIRPYKVTFTEEVIKDLKYRLKNAKALTPPLKDVAWNYGTNTNALRKFLDHWANNYNFEEREKYLNQYLHFKTNIQGLDIHFIHAKPTNTEGKRVLPLLLVHGWPGSIVEFYKIIPLLTSARAEHDFVFEVIAPSLPGFGFSSAAAIPELSSLQMSVVLKNLMLRLGYDKYYVQGGDWGASVIHTMSCLYPQYVLGMHSNLCIVLGKWTLLKKTLLSFLPWAESKKKPSFSMLVETGYYHIQATKPDTVGVGLNDSPAGLAAYIIEKFLTGTNPFYKYREDGGFLEKFTYDELIDNLMIYWVSNSNTTAMRIYAEFYTKSNRTLSAILESTPIKVPSACVQFPHEIMEQSPSELRKRFVNLLRVTKMPRGGHFAAFEEPELLADDIWISIDEMEKWNKKYRETVYEQEENKRNS